MNPGLDFSFVHSDLNPLVRFLVWGIKTNTYVNVVSLRLRLLRSTSRVISCRGIVRSSIDSSALSVKSAASPVPSPTGTGPKVCPSVVQLGLRRAHSRSQILTISIVHPSSIRIPSLVSVDGVTPRMISRSQLEPLPKTSCCPILLPIPSVGTSP